MATTNAAGETYEEVRRRKLEENRRKVDKFNKEAAAAAAANPSPCLFSIATTNSFGESYAEARRRKLEENRKRLEEINLRCLSTAAAGSTTPKPSPAKKVWGKLASEDGSVHRRRSPRFLDPKVIAEVVQQSGKVSKHRDLSGCVSDEASCVSDEARKYAKEKAGEKKVKLGTDHPSFVKPMRQSNTSGRFWLGIPGFFATTYLPKSKSTFTLVDEDGKESDTTYVADSRGLSVGWRGFSIDHDLVDGDALVFQLIKQTTFKVYIVRAKNYRPS